MENNITIVDAIKTVLQDSSEGMTSQEIYNKIVERKLYTFGAKTPEAAVHAKLRVYCRDLDFGFWRRWCRNSCFSQESDIWKSKCS